MIFGGSTVGHLRNRENKRGLQRKINFIEGGGIGSEDGAGVE